VCFGAFTRFQRRLSVNGVVRDLSFLFPDGILLCYSDLNPENILLDYTGHIALCDFGE
jgi:serine/threonine protein kinase